MRMLLAVVATTAGMFVMPSSPVQAELLADLAIDGYDGMVLDEAHGHLFISQGTNGSGVVVTALDGTPVATLDDTDGSGRIALAHDGSTIWIPTGEHAIVGFDTATLTEVDRFDLAADVCPNAVTALDDGLIAFGNPCSHHPSNGGIGVLDTSTGTAKYSVAGPFYWPLLASSPGSGATFVAGDRGLSPTTLYVFDVEDGAPVLVNDLWDPGENLQSLAVSPDGTRVVMASGWPYTHNSFTIPALEPSTTYPSVAYPNAVAWSADGSTVVTGTNSSYEADIRIHDAATGQVIRTIESGALEANGLAVSTDGNDVFAVGPWFQGHASLQHFGPVPEGSIVLFEPGWARVGLSYQLSGTIVFDGLPAVGLEVNVDRHAPDGSVESIGTAISNQQGKFQFEDGPTTVGTTTYVVSFAGDATHLPVSASVVVDVLPRISLPPTVTLTIDAPGEVGLGDAVYIDGSLELDGVPAADVGIAISRIGPDDTVQSLGTVTTDGSGYYFAEDSPQEPGIYVYHAVLLSAGGYPPTDESIGVSVVEPEPAPERDIPPPLSRGDVFPLTPIDPPDAPSLYTSLVPARVLDTRPTESTVDGLGRPGVPLGAGRSLDLQVLGRAGIPADGVDAVVLNVTAANPTTPSFLTLWPAGSARPQASNLNFVAGQVVPNLVVAKVGTAGNVSIYNLAGNVDVIVDVAGYFPDTDDFEPLVPARLLDTRPGMATIDGLGLPGAPIGADRSLDLQVVGRGGVPTSGVDAVVLNLTATNPTAASYLTVWPTGQPRPVASNVNMVRGTTAPNLVVAKVGAAGNVSIYNLAGSVDVIADVAGYFPTGGRFVSVQPSRVFDSRMPQPQLLPPTLPPSTTPIAPPDLSLGSRTTVDVDVLGVGGVPDERVAAVVLNVTAIGPSAGSFLTVWPTGVERPNASNVNTVAGGPPRPNLVVARVGAGGHISIYNESGSVDVAVDVAGYFLEEPSPIRTLDVTDTNACALDWLGRLTCWGRTPQDPYPSYPLESVRSPYRVTTVDRIVDVGLSQNQTCALLEDGHVWCRFARNFGGGVSIGAVGPVEVKGLTGVVGIAGEGARMCALQDDGRLGCWDDPPPTTTTLTAILVPGIDDAMMFSVGPTDACVLRLDYHVACWGTNGESGILGDGNSTDSPTLPVTVATIDDAIGIGVAGDHACAWRYGYNEVVCWGESYLGDGYAEGWPTPVAVQDQDGYLVTDAAWMVGGDDWNCLMRSDDGFYCWGSEAAGQLGLTPPGGQTTVTVPHLQLPPASYVAAANRYMCVVDDESVVRCWGDNTVFRFAQPNVTVSTTPVVVYDPELM